MNEEAAWNSGLARELRPELSRQMRAGSYSFDHVIPGSGVQTAMERGFGAEK